MAGAVPLVLVAALVTSCSSPTAPDGGDRLHVVASAYPLAELAERVGGELVDVENLTPPGVEPHDLELSPGDLERSLTAELVLMVGGGFQPAVEDAVGGAEGRVVDALEVLDAAAIDGEAVGDPHVWLDPMLLAELVPRVAGVFAEVDPANAPTYRSAADGYVAELEELDAAFRDGLSSCARRTIVVNHAAFTYLAAAYDLEQVSISGVSPESEPDPARLAELRDLVVREGITTIFTEELASPEVAETLAREAGVTTAVLDPLEGLTTSELEVGEDYGSIMRRNLDTLRRALDCD